MSHTTMTVEELRAQAEKGTKPMAKEQQEKKNGRQHKATYARDQRKGGYIIRVEGPNANRFAGRTVPVTRKDGSEDEEKLLNLLWSGNDQESGKPVALYEFEPKPRNENYDDIPF